MSKYYIYQDTKRCIGCYSCESHCKTKNNLPIGPRLTQIISVGPRKINNLPRMAYVFMPCFHCQDPWCVAACPTGAMQKRPEDGIVFVDDKLCVGCKACITACPWGTPQWNPQTFVGEISFHIYFGRLIGTPFIAESTTSVLWSTPNTSDFTKKFYCLRILE